jgi:predicted ATPase
MPTTVPRIVITGAPASGKTVFFERLRTLPALRDFIFFDELARRILIEDPSFRGRWAAFHREIYRRQVARESEAGERPFITDRGTVDAFAFHSETAADVGTTIEAEYRRYTAVVQLGSSACLGKEYYAIDPVRQETPAETLEIERRIRLVWQGHPRFHFIAAGTSLETKYSTFEALIMRLAGNAAE